MIAVQFGIKWSKKLKAGALPSLFPKSISQAGPSKRHSQDSDGSSVEVVKKRGTDAEKNTATHAIIKFCVRLIVSTRCTGRLLVHQPQHTVCRLLLVSVH